MGGPELNCNIISFKSLLRTHSSTVLWQRAAGQTHCATAGNINTQDWSNVGDGEKHKQEQISGFAASIDPFESIIALQQQHWTPRSHPQDFFSNSLSNHAHKLEKNMVAA